MQKSPNIPKYFVIFILLCVFCAIAMLFCIKPSDNKMKQACLDKGMEYAKYQNNSRLVWCVIPDTREVKIYVINKD